MEVQLEKAVFINITSFFYYTILNSHDKFEKFVWFCAVAFLKFRKQDKRKVDLNLALPNVLSQHSKTDWEVEIG